MAHSLPKHLDEGNGDDNQSTDGQKEDRPLLVYDIVERAIHYQSRLPFCKTALTSSLSAERASCVI